MYAYQHRAVFASHFEHSRGRLYSEPESLHRTPFQRDRDRIVHSTAFRRLKHKTQVFVYHEGDHYRTRLTHSIEVAQIARSIARALGLDEDLTEALSLAHDFGHTPFGHAGETALHEEMSPYGGFDHNAQTLRIVTKLEHRYAEFDGLNLTWETLEGLVKHNGPLLAHSTANLSGLAAAVREYANENDLDLHLWPGVEAQVSALADDVAYNNHDIDDGLRAGLFDLDDVATVPLIGEIVVDVRRQYPMLSKPRLIHETVRRVIDRMVSDLIEETSRRLAIERPKSVEDVRTLGGPVVAFSSKMAETNRIIKEFLHDAMYGHYKLNRSHAKAKRIVKELFAFFFEHPDCLPTEWRKLSDRADELSKARLVADYIAGMTDAFALQEAQRLFERDTGI